MATKPLCLRMDEAQKELDTFIGQLSMKHDLPCFILEPLVSDVLNRLQNGKRIEIENEKRSYEHKLAEEAMVNDKRDSDNS